MMTNMQESLGESNDARQRIDVAEEILKAATTQNLTLLLMKIIYPMHTT